MAEEIREEIKEEAEDKKSQKTAYTYILSCADGSLYTGWTYDLAKRLKTHNDGKGAKYTKSRLPVALVYAEAHAAKEEAMQREYAIKQLERKEKLMLCEAGQRETERLWKMFFE